MPLEAVVLDSILQLYAFVEDARPKTALVLIPDALFRPWVRSVSAECREVRWCHTAVPLSRKILEHLSNFAHAPLPESGFVLFERGQVIKVVDVAAVGGASRPDKLGFIVRQAFEPKRKSEADVPPPTPAQREAPQPYQILGADPSDSDADVKKKYKEMMMLYHPDRVAHLGAELKELAARKTTEINTAFAAIRQMRGF